MWMPVSRDDLSVLGNDLFSTIIRDSYSENVLVKGKDLRYTQIDQRKALTISKATINDILAQEIIELFINKGGCCERLDSDFDHQMTCKVVKTCKIKMIGTLWFDTSESLQATVRLTYIFLLSSSDEIINVELSITDATQYIPIY